jgi:probable phosphoglycerate mutase
VGTDARLRERGLGHWEGKTRDEVRTLYPDEYAAWIAGRDVSSRGGETRDEVAERAMQVFGELPDVETAVLVTHGATSMALAAAVLGLSQSVHVLGPLANCHWSELLADTSEPGHHGSGPAWRLRAHNVGVPGTVVPLPVAAQGPVDDGGDAEA